MRHILSALILLAAFAAPASAQTVKALSYGTNGRFITGTNVLTFSNQINFAGGDVEILSGGMIRFAGTDRLELETATLHGEWNFTEPESVRGQLGFVTNLNTLWTATNASNARSAIGLSATWLTNNNVTNFRTAIGLGATNSVNFLSATIDGNVINGSGFFYSGNINSGINLEENWLKDGNDQTVFNWGDSTLLTIGRPIAGLTNNGDITINQTTATNGLLFIRRTNNEAFLGMANLIASNNTTVSNETLFRVGVAEATNRSAQFGFRTVRTNNGGEGFATFSVFGYNALMMIGPSDRSRTNTATNAAIEADIYTITGSNRVMTLRDTNSGALTLHQELGFGAGLTNTAPTNTNTPAAWLRVWVGTNGNYRLPLYQ
jgi:hypothetical protein